MSLVDELKLEVDTSTVPNIMTNHSGQTGNTGGWDLWSYNNGSGTTTMGSDLYAYSPARFGHYAYQGVARCIRALAKWNGGSGGSAIQNATIASTAFSCLGFSHIGATAKISTTTPDNAITAEAVVRITFYDGAGGIIPGDFDVVYSTAIRSSNGVVALNGPAVAVPANATTFRLLLIYAYYTNSPLQSVSWSSVYLARGNSAASVSNLTFSDGTFTDLIPGSLSLALKRGGDVEGVTDKIDPGTLTAVIRDPAVDPASNTYMRPGRAVRIRAKRTNNAWEPIFTGTITALDTSYGSGTVVTLTATDAVTSLSTSPQPLAFDGSWAQRIARTVAGTNVLHNAQGTGGTLVVTQSAIDASDNATALDQLVNTRNAFNAYVWPDKSNVIQAYLPAALPTDPTVTFRDRSTYAPVGSSLPVDYQQDIDVSFGSKALINTVSITRSNRTETDGEKTYGPYRNGASVGQWGEISDTVHVNDGTPSALAATYLATFDDPKIFPNELSFSALKHRNAAIDIDLYQRARVVFRDKLDADYRIVAIEHEISATSWQVKVRFRPLEASSTITVTNPPGGANAGPADIVPPVPGPLASRYRSTNISIANNTPTTLAFDSSDVADQITYDGTNNRFVIPRDGRYQINAGVSWQGNATGNRLVFIHKNGTALVRFGGATQSANQPQIAGSKTVKCVTGDVVSIVVQHTAGASIAVAASAARETYVDITYLGE